MAYINTFAVIPNKLGIRLIANRNRNQTLSNNDNFIYKYEPNYFNVLIKEFNGNLVVTFNDSVIGSISNPTNELKQIIQGNYKAKCFTIGGERKIDNRWSEYLYDGTEIENDSYYIYVEISEING